MPESWEPIHPDSLVGPELDELVALFGDVDWQDQAAVEQRVADLHAAHDAQAQRSGLPGWTTATGQPLPE